MSDNIKQNLRNAKACIDEALECLDIGQDLMAKSDLYTAAANIKVAQNLIAKSARPDVSAPRREE